MSGDGSPDDQPVDCSDLRVAVVAASWHEQVMDGLVAGAKEALDAYRVGSSEIVRVSGSFELPVVAQALARKGYDAVVALGVVIRGGTPHFDYVCSAATDGLNRSLSRPESRSASGCSPATPRSRHSTAPASRAATRARGTTPRQPHCAPPAPCARSPHPSPRSDRALTERAITEGTLGAWLVKASPASLPIEELVRTGFVDITSRCVRATYRTDLVRSGQPVLLWVSGNDPRHPAGIYASGHTTGPVDEVAPKPEMPVLLRAVQPAVNRKEILDHPTLSCIEVIRMPAGSNPSYLDAEQYDALLQAFPQVAGS